MSKCFVDQLLALAVAAWAFLGMPSNARAQCESSWYSAGTVQGTSDRVLGMTQLPNGDVLVLGTFTTVFDVIAGGTALYHPQTRTWSPFGTPLRDTTGSLPPPKMCALPMPNGDVLVGGRFNEAGGATIRGIARWDGTQWNQLGDGINGAVYAMLANPDGSVTIGGSFNVVGNSSITNIARWDGSAWSALGDGFDNRVFALVRLANGSLVAAGAFTAAGATPVSAIAQWDGVSWQPLAGGIVPQTLGGEGGVYDLLVRSNGTLVAGGLFTSARTSSGVNVPGTRNVALWDGTTWSPLTGAPNFNSDGVVRTLTSPNGSDVIIGGTSVATPSGQPCCTDAVLRWDGTQLLGMNHIDQVISLLSLPDSSVLAGGVMTFPRNIDQWIAGTWSATSTSQEGVGGPVFSMLELPDGRVAAGGSLLVRSSGTSRIALWDGDNIELISGNVHGNVLVLEWWNNMLVAAGQVTVLQSSTLGVAAWNGSTWSIIGPNVNFAGTIYALEAAPNGTLYAAGQFNVTSPVALRGIAQWNGTAWQPLGTGLLNTNFESIRSLKILPSGVLVAGGAFSSIGGVSVASVASWNGSQWQTMGLGLNGVVNALTLDTNNTLVAGGTFTSTGSSPISRVAAWNGESWISLGTGPSSFVNSLVTLENGEIVAAGSFNSADGQPASRIARWNGANWLPLGTGLENGTVTSLALFGNGDLAASGAFTVAGNVVSNYLARWSTTCECDSIDFNNDNSIFDPQDIEAFLSVYSEGPCIPASATCNDIDFNNDGSIFDPEDINSFLRVYSEGPCRQ